MALEIYIDVEARNKEFHVQVENETTVEETISTLIRRCTDEGIDIHEWGRSKVGNGNVSFVMLRKATGSTALAPNITFGEIFPEIEEHETFKIDARAQVGEGEAVLFGFAFGLPLVLASLFLLSVSNKAKKEREEQQDQQKSVTTFVRSSDFPSSFERNLERNMF